MHSAFIIIRPSISPVIRVEKRLVRPLIAVLALWLVFILSATAEDSGIIYCGATSSNFTVPVRLERGKGLLVENAYCGEPITLLGIVQGYAKIRSWYSTGYVSLDFVQLAVKPLKPAISFDRAFIDCGEPIDVPVYSNLQTKSVITTLKCSQPVGFIDMERGYVRIQIADRIGYVDSKFITLERRPLDPNPEAQPAISALPPAAKVIPQQKEEPPQTPAPLAIVPAALTPADSQNR